MPSTKIELTKYDQYEFSLTMKLINSPIKIMNIVQNNWKYMRLG